MSEDGKRLAERRTALVQQGKLEAAIKSLDQCIKKEPQDSLLYRERAHLHLYLGQLPQARADFDVTARLEAEVFGIKPGRLQSDLEYCAIGVTYWLEGHRDLALAFWRYVTSLLCMNHVSYAGVGGGIETGLLLWFGAVHERREDDIALMRTLFEKRLESTLWSHDLSSWPGPIVRFFLEQIDEQGLIDGAEECDQALCEAHFAAAIRARERSRNAAYKKHLKQAAPFTSPAEIFDYYNVLPYFLARYELDIQTR